MNMRNLSLIALISVLLTSCMSTSFYQVYKATPSDKIVLKEKMLVYEDENCKISYNLWEDGGNIGFKILNKNDKNLYLNLEESFFILNGNSYDYYKNRVFTNSKNTGLSTYKTATASKSVTGINYLDLIQTNRIAASNNSGFITSAGYSVSYNEEKIICVPSHTSKEISEYNINEALYRDCDLLKYPTSKQIKTKTFTKSNSPLVFSNRIAYYIGQSDKLQRFENEFYIAEITNYPEKEIIESKYSEFCGEKSMTMTKYFKNDSPDKFYLKYNKGQDSKH